MTLLEWGVRSNAPGLLFFPRDGGSCRARLSSVCVSVTPADRKNQHFCVFFATRSGRAEARVRAKRTIFERCKDPSRMLPKTLSLHQKLHFAHLNGRNNVFGMCLHFNAKTGVPPPPWRASGAAQEGPGATGRTEQDAFLAHPRQVRRLKMMK